MQHCNGQSLNWTSVLCWQFWFCIYGQLFLCGQISNICVEFSEALQAGLELCGLIDMMICLRETYAGVIRWPLRVSKMVRGWWRLPLKPADLSLIPGPCVIWKENKSHKLVFWSTHTSACPPQMRHIFFWGWNRRTLEDPVAVSCAQASFE